jgi:UDPglucose 6-dehydrogenase
MSYRIGVAGMTHLGLVTATGFAAKGFPTICYDADAELTQRLSSGVLPVSEPDLDDLVRANGATQRFTSALADLAGCDVVYIAPDVPTDDAARSDLSGVRALLADVFDAIAPSAIVVVLCQVPPGFTRGLGRSASRLYYQVETLVFGRAVERTLQPERYIVGAADPSSPLPAAYASLLAAFDCPVLQMRYESAELAKIAINFCLVASISVANTLGELCEEIGADWSEIAPALKLDKRIGAFSYLTPGLGIAGGNLERDLETVRGLAAKHGTDAAIVEAWISNSRRRRDWAYGILWRTLLKAKPDALIGVLGLAYKENTHSTKNSPSLALVKQLDAAKLRVHDPMVPANAAPGAVGCADPYAAADGADALAVMTPWPAYRSLDPVKLAARMSGRVLVDPYGLVEGAAAAGFDHFTLGRPMRKGTAR